MSSATSLRFSFAAALLFAAGCTTQPVDSGPMDDGPVAENISGKLGDPMPSASSSQLATFERGRSVMSRRFDLADGLGPSFTSVSCGSCHEKPTLGGGAGLYRNFFIGGRLTSDGAFLFSDSDGDAGGILRFFRYALDGLFRPAVPESTTIFAQRNSIPTFGAGLLAAISDEEILSRVDEDDADGDGISGRANFDRGFVGRFGRKAQVVSIETFIRGPLFNHVGITSDPLTDESRAQLPVDSALAARIRNFHRTPAPKQSAFRDPHQAAAPDGPTTDDDGVADPELSSQDLFDLVSFIMLLAAPELDEPTEQSNSGRLLFHEANCSACHTPRVQGSTGPLHIYSDLLLHDMGDGLADGLVMNLASSSEFRTQPLWGIASVGPYLHDGRASTLSEAILAHGGESQNSRDAFAAMSAGDQDNVVEFLMSLGGRNQASDGLLEPNEPIAGVGEYGGPLRALTTGEEARFLRGRALFDKDFGLADGAGNPRFNGDSCRACHFDPTIGGSGPRDVNVMRHGIMNDQGDFLAPSVGTILHKQTAVSDQAIVAQDSVNVYEHRQPPHVFGLGLLDQIDDDTITAGADPDDADGDGISGRVSITDGGQIGRLGWKAQVPSIAEFVRDAITAELGLTVEFQPGLTFGKIDDNDDIDDPEVSAGDAEDLTFFLSMLAPPPRQGFTGNEAAVTSGQTLFDTVGCAKCHVPTLGGAEGLYSDLLLHEILAADSTGIEDTSANVREFRTTPLWGLSQTAPYFHSGEADTIDQAIGLHEGEAAAIRDAFEALDQADRNALLAFLGTL